MYICTHMQRMNRPHTDTQTQTRRAHINIAHCVYVLAYISLGSCPAWSTPLHHPSQRAGHPQCLHLCLSFDSTKCAYASKCSPHPHPHPFPTLTLAHTCAQATSHTHTGSPAGHARIYIYTEGQDNKEEWVVVGRLPACLVGGGSKGYFRDVCVGRQHPIGYIDREVSTFWLSKMLFISICEIDR